MKIPQFKMERWQSVYENTVELNISESGVKPLSSQELIEDPADLAIILATPLGYPQSNGSEELRERVALQFPGARVENVLVTTGCAEANFHVALSLIESGDEVVFMQPNYMQVGGLARGLGANVKSWWLRENLRWAPDLAELDHLVTSKTRLIVVCNPNNPTGAVLTEPAMDAICRAAAKVGAWLLADEVYRGAEFDGNLTPTFWGRYERVLCTGGLSKSYGLPGLRTGWVVAPGDFCASLWSYKDYTTISASLLSDRLASHALEPARRDRLFERTRCILRENYPILAEWLAKRGSAFAHVPPRAGAIAWVRYAGTQKSAALAEELRARKSVLLVPGEQFEMEHFIRVGFGYDAGVLRHALERMEDILARTTAA
ncbi:MAG: aminotransferase class I/II-fold pyridoxal phosphate-dependent enzyme [Candidatus Acidiferrales bacterium]